MNTMSGGSIFLSLMKDEGVTHLFGNPGTTELPIMHALAEHPDLTYVLGLQEAVVLAMADGYARGSGRLTACNVHVAPGLGNAMGSLFNARWSGSPVIVSAGQQEQGHGLTEPLLYGPLVEMASPLVKWACEVTRTEDLPRIVRRAAKVAMTPPTGPVFLSLPGDVLNAEVGVELGQATRVDVDVRPTDEALATLATRLLRANNPVIVCGSELRSDDALAEAAELAELLGAAVYSQSVTSGAFFPTEHPCFVAGLTRSQPQVRDTLAPYDLMVALGGDVLRMSVYSEVEPLPEGLAVVQIGQDDWEIAKNYAVEHAVRAQLKVTLSALAGAVRTQMNDANREAAAARLEALATRNWTTSRATLAAQLTASDAGVPLNPDRVMLELVSSLPRDAIVVEEGLLSTRQLPALLPLRERHDFFGLDSGGIGFAIAGAVGVSLANPDRRVVAVIGDGSAMYSIQALWSAAHMQAPITYVIANNSSYRILKERLLAFHDNDQFTGMNMREPPIEFANLARSMGLWAERVTNIDELQEVLRAAHAHQGASLVEVMVADGFEG